MNNFLDSTLRELNDCGCCAGTSAQTPATMDNRPGLPSIGFRAGVHSQFMASLLAALSSRHYPELRGLGTRAGDDFTIALLDAFACTADVLTFYSERIANEAYLRTATERRSVLELARAIGYELAPGVSAGVMLTFTIEGGVGAPGNAIIPQGTKVQSIPGPGEDPQVYETSAEFSALAAWNELRPRLRAAPPSADEIPHATQLYLSGTATNLKLGDVIVLSSGSVASAKRISEVVVDREKNHTNVKFEAGSTPRPVPPRRRRDANALATTGLNLGLQPTEAIVDGLFRQGSVSSIQLRELTYFYGWDAAKVQRHLNALPRVTLFPADAGVFALRARAGLFGHNAPRHASLPDPAMRNAFPNDWDDLKVPVDDGVSIGPSKIWMDSQGVDLNPADTQQFDVLIERAMPEVISGSWLVLESESSTLVPLRVGRNSELSRADFAMSAKCARLNLKNPDGETDPEKNATYTTRGTTAHLQSERLEVIGEPITTDLIPGQTALELDRIDANLFEGQLLALKGEDADLPGTTNREIAAVAAINHGDVTTLTLKAGLQHRYLRNTVTLNANVVHATHGATTQEVLGSGDAAQAFQRFTLKQKPLTYAFPPDAENPESSLEIWVDDVRWRESSTFYEKGPKDRVYIVRHQDDGPTTVQFGDGRNGARLPSGPENVRAVYRKGIGLDGLVDDEQISLMLTQPLGVKAVSNLLAPRGAENPQSLDDARINAPRTVLTLDRVVSLQDYEDFARDFPGVDKAHAAWTWAGQTRGIALTLLGPNGSTISDGDTDQPAAPLRKALASQGISRVPVRIVSRPPSLFRISGSVRVDADRDASVVRTAVTAAMVEAFSFARREFGQGVHLSEVVAVIQNVPGVTFIDITAFEKKLLVAGTTTTIPATRDYLNAFNPANGVDWIRAQPAELLILDEPSLSQLEVTA